MNTIKTTKKALAQKLGISRSSLYYQPKKPPKYRALKYEIELVMTNNPAYGYRRVAGALSLGKERVRRAMRMFGLWPKVCRARRPFKPDDTRQKEHNKENIAIRLCPIRLNTVWAGDFTYFWFYGRFWYLATVIDVFTREIVGWHIANHHTTALITKAFTNALTRTEKTPMWFHSDQGSEYVSGGYAMLLTQYGVIASQSKKSSPWQNGFQESFYSQFKLELGNPNRFNHVGELIEAIHQQIFYYNNRRIHSAHKMPPIVFKEKQQLKYAAYAAS